MPSRASWKDYDVEILERTLKALVVVAQAKHLSLKERFDRVGLLFDADGLPVAISRRSILFTNHVHINIMLENGIDRAIVICPCDMPAPPTIQNGAAATALRAAVTAARLTLERTIVTRYCHEYSNETAAVTKALRVHLARFLSSPMPRPATRAGSVVATGLIPFDRTPEVSMRLPGSGPAIRFKSADGRPALPLPSFRHVLDITCHESRADGPKQYHVSVLPVSMTASMGRLPSDPMKVVRLLRDETIPNLVEIA